LLGIEITKEKIIIKLAEIEDGKTESLIYDKGELSKIIIRVGNMDKIKEDILNLIVEDKTKIKIEITERYKIHNYELENGTLRLILWMQSQI